MLQYLVLYSKGQSTTLWGIYRPSGSCHSAQQLLASRLSFYLRMHICTLSKSQVSEAPHLAQFPNGERRCLSVDTLHLIVPPCLKKTNRLWKSQQEHALLSVYPSVWRLQSGHACWMSPKLWRALRRFLGSTETCRHEILEWRCRWWHDSQKL